MSKRVNGAPGNGARRHIDIGPLDTTFGFLLRAAWRDASRSFKKHFRAYDINPQQFATLVMISRNPGCAPGDLTEPLGVTPNNLVRLIEGLGERQLVEKTADPDDKRVRLLHLTDEGERLLEELFVVHSRYDAEYNELLGPDRIEELCNILRFFR